jgi:hypothetical protein
MSIRPSVIDRTGDRPCLPANALLAVCERLAEGGTFAARARDRCIGNNSATVSPMTPHPPDQSLMALVILCALALLCAWSVNFFIELLK